jgi:hypothetical protein
MKFTKKEFEESYKPDEIDELYDPTSGDLSGDIPVMNTSQVFTDTPVLPSDDSSDREMGIPTTTNQYSANAKNNKQQYPFQGFNMGVPYGYYSVYESKDKLSELIKKRVEKVMEDLVDGEGNKNGLISIDNYSDLNKNNVPDISEIEDIKIIEATKTFLNKINDSDELEVFLVLNHLLDNIKVSELDSKLKNILKSKF